MKYIYPPHYDENQARKAEIWNYNQWVKQKFPWWTRWFKFYANSWGTLGCGWGSIIDFKSDRIVVKIYLDYKNSWYVEDFKIALLQEETNREVTIKWEYLPAEY